WIDRCGMSFLKNRINADQSLRIFQCEVESLHGRIGIAMGVEQDNGFILLPLSQCPVRVNDLAHCHTLAASGFPGQADMLPHFLRTCLLEESPGDVPGKYCFERFERVSSSSG